MVETDDLICKFLAQTVKNSQTNLNSNKTDSTCHEIKLNQSPNQAKSSQSSFMKLGLKSNFDW